MLFRFNHRQKRKPHRRCEILCQWQRSSLAQNENDNNLHSGPDGFEKKLWKVAEISDDKNSVIFNHISPDGENGFPGEFDVSVKYEFTEDNELRIHYQGICDEPTVAI